MELTYTRKTALGEPTTVRLTPSEVGRLIKVMRADGCTVQTSDEGVIISRPAGATITYTVI